ncbi:MAG: O-antigen ligase family protein [Planctomycetaceae bacterium]|nr:O-antigen ligase family protein [Planctomycetaceae bacterium]
MFSKNTSATSATSRATDATRIVGRSTDSATGAISRVTVAISLLIRVIGLLSLSAAVLATPWCFGSIHASVQVWLFPMIMLSLVCALFTLLFEGFFQRGMERGKFPYPLLLVPLLLMLLLIGLQLRPHDQASLGKHSPKAAELRALLLPAPDSAEYRWIRDEGLVAEGLGTSDEGSIVDRTGTPGSKVAGSGDSPDILSPIPYPPVTLEKSPLEKAPTSIYPAATRHQLSLFVLVISAFFAASVLFKDQKSKFKDQSGENKSLITWNAALCTPINLFGAAAVVNGCALALIGIVLRLNPHIKTFLIWDNDRGGFGIFINYNNAAGYLGMCLGLAVFFLLWYFFRSNREIEDNRRWDTRFERNYMTTKHVIAWQFSRMIAPGILIWGFLAGILIAGILVSMSRGGSLAMGTALLTVFLVVFVNRRFKLPILGLALIGIMGLGLVFWTGMDERVQKRLESITNEKADGVRLLNWSNAMDTARDFRWQGAGFGTYQYANLLNDELAARHSIATRAENQYVEIFLDLGPWGLAFLLTCPTVAILLCWRLIRYQDDDWLTALGGGLLVVVMTQVVASLFDFGLYITANALLLAVCCGILSAASNRCPKKNDENEETSERARLNTACRVGRICCAGGLFATGCLFLVLTWWGSKEIGNIHRIDLAMERLDRCLRHDNRTGDYRSASPDELADAVAQLEAAIQYRPDDATATLALAEAQIGLYRQTIYRDLHAMRHATMSDDDIWNRTSLLSVHESLGRLRRLGFIAQANIIREHPAVEQYLRPAFVNLARSRQSNPMSEKTHLRIAQLMLLLDKDDRLQEFEQNVGKRAVTVSPLSAAAWFEIGILERNAGRTADARAYWKQSLSLSRLYLQPIVQLTKANMRGDNAQDLFRETFPNSPDLFLILATRHFTNRDIPSFRQEALDALKESCETAVAIPEEERHYYRGRYEMLVENYEAAVTELKAACTTQRTNPEWRYQLARAYYSNRQYKEAQEAIQSALFYDPGHETYGKLRDDIEKAVILH